MNGAWDYSSDPRCGSRFYTAAFYFGHLVLFYPSERLTFSVDQLVKLFSVEVPGLYLKIGKSLYHHGYPVSYTALGATAITDTVPHFMFVFGGRICATYICQTSNFFPV